jgi:hypothetical protein
MNVSFVVSHGRASSLLIQSDNICSVNTDNTLLWICEVTYAIQSRRFTFDYLCMLSVGDGVKRRFGRIVP